MVLAIFYQWYLHNVDIPTISNNTWDTLSFLQHLFFGSKLPGDAWKAQKCVKCEKCEDPCSSFKILWCLAAKGLPLLDFDQAPGGVACSQQNYLETQAVTNAFSVSSSQFSVSNLGQSCTTKRMVELSWHPIKNGMFTTYELVQDFSKFSSPNLLLLPGAPASRTWPGEALPGGLQDIHIIRKWYAQFVCFLWYGEMHVYIYENIHLLQYNWIQYITIEYIILQ